MLINGLQKSSVCRDITFPGYSFKNLPVAPFVKVAEKARSVIGPEPAQPERLMDLTVHT